MSHISDPVSSEHEYKKVTMRFPKSFHKDLKRYAVEHDTTMTKVIVDACNEFVNNKMQTELTRIINESKNAQPSWKTIH